MVLKKMKSISNISIQKLIDINKKDYLILNNTQG